MLFMKFMVQFIHFFPGLFEGALSSGRDSIDPALSALNTIKRRSEQAGSLQAVQKRIKRARPDPVAMMFQFVHHRKAKDGLVRRM
jgi:hypothetical protein